MRPGGAGGPPYGAARPVVTGTGAFIPAGAGSRRAPRRERPGAVARAGPTVRCGRAAQAPQREHGAVVRAGRGCYASLRLSGRFVLCDLVDPASSHMLVSKIKPCMSKYKLLHSETANGSLDQLIFIRSYKPTWITVAILELIHANELRPSGKSAFIRSKPIGGSLCVPRHSW